jgi:hypothetical protein
VAQCDKTLQSYPEDAESLQFKKYLSSLSAGPGIGEVILASGYRTVADGEQGSKRRRVDWALIEAPTTFAPNKLPPKADIPVRYTVHPNYLQNRDSKVREFGWVKKGDGVTNIGRRTEVTTAEVNSMERRVQWGSWKRVGGDEEPGKEESGEKVRGRTTSEIEIFSHDGSFAQPGDTGSLVFGSRGELLGTIFAIDSWPGRFNMSFMTPIHVIQEDIKRETEWGFLSFG